MTNSILGVSALEERVHTILVVEDSYILRYTLVEWLRLSGHFVLEAASAHEAKILLQSEPAIDLVITDVEMPGPMNGYDLALYIQHDHSDLPVIIVSGTASREKFSQIGIINFFEKPYELKEMTNRVERLLQSNGIMNAVIAQLAIIKTGRSEFSEASPMVTVKAELVS